MSEITQIIDPQAYELILFRIYEILKSEIDEQAYLTEDADLKKHDRYN
jgi:hypothetical protein